MAIFLLLCSVPNTAPDLKSNVFSKSCNKHLTWHMELKTQEEEGRKRGCIAENTL